MIWNGELVTRQKNVSDENGIIITEVDGGLLHFLSMQ